MALRKAGVPAELHIYERGPHGVGLAQTDEALSTWPSRLADWLRGPRTAERRPEIGVAHEIRITRCPGIGNVIRANHEVSRRRKRATWWTTITARRSPTRTAGSRTPTRPRRRSGSRRRIASRASTSPPFRSAARYKDRLTTLFNYERFTGFEKAGPHYLITRNDGLQNQDVLYVADSLARQGAGAARPQHAARRRHRRARAASSRARTASCWPTDSPTPAPTGSSGTCAISRPAKICRTSSAGASSPARSGRPTSAASTTSASPSRSRAKRCAARTSSPSSTCTASASRSPPTS